MNPHTPSGRRIGHERIHAQNTRWVLMPPALVRLTLACRRSVAVTIVCLVNLNERMLLRHLLLRSHKEEMRLEKNSGDCGMLLANVLPSSILIQLLLHACTDPVASTETDYRGTCWFSTLFNYSSFQGRKKLPTTAVPAYRFFLLQQQRRIN